MLLLNANSIFLLVLRGVLPDCLLLFYVPPSTRMSTNQQLCFILIIAENDLCFWYNSEVNWCCRGVKAQGNDT